jgi:AAA15 family ATPase/GTPase
MAKLKRMILKNFCGYKHFDIDLQDEKSILKWVMLYGPNGVGKSNFLEAVSLLSYPWVMQSREDTTLFFRKLTYHPDYKPGIESFNKNRTEMSMEAIFKTDDGDKRVIIKNNWVPEESGVILNELDIERSNSLYIDADNPMNMHIFQLKSHHKEKFIDFAEAVYGFKCDIPDSWENIVEEYDSATETYVHFYTDFVITKPDKTRVHFKRMSDGEKKIATMIRSLFHRCEDSKDAEILLMDNIEMHIYFKRHMNLIRKMEEYFPNHQIIATTHSPIIVNEMKEKYLFDLEKYIGK